MPLTTPYPGVYIQELPSGVHTVTGVATSITAFVGYTARGTTDPTEIFSWSDFVRTYGGLSLDSPLSYAVSQFFENGGTDAFIVRVAQGTNAASVDVKSPDSGPNPVLTLTASSVGTWGNQVQADVDYMTVNPNSLFNLTLTGYVLQDAVPVVQRTEVYRNLTMDRYAQGYAVDTINAASQLVMLTPGGTLPTTPATSQSAALLASDLTNLMSPLGAYNNRVAASVNGGAPVEVVFFTSALDLSNFGNALTTIAGDIASALNAVLGLAGAAAITSKTVNSNALQFTVPPPPGMDLHGSIHFQRASRNDATSILKLGVANSGIEIDSAAKARPAQTGTTGGSSLASPPAFPADASIKITMSANGAQVGPTTLPVWGAGTNPPVVAPSTYADAARLLQNAMNSQNMATQPGLAGSTVNYANGAFHVIAGGTNPNLKLTFDNDTGNIADLLQLKAAYANVTHYALGVGAKDGAQQNAVLGVDGTAPADMGFIGDPIAKTGIYSLEKVDLFNLLCLVGVETPSVFGLAAQYCEQRRAFLIFDLPQSVQSVSDARQWMQDPMGGGQIPSRNAAAYFPRFEAADPLLGNQLRSFPTCGAVAGVFARIDGQRNVWKAPAGQQAYVLSAAQLDVPLTNSENGVLNPLGLNCLRAFPSVGIVVWGARTMRGSDVLADDYKYVPVRRLALYLEESLYRGTQWVVFEPNDEPLWAQIRLNLGAFMHQLFSQGAFAGQTARDAYFVKCDGETTTALDQDQGRVNVVVGFAPLKPAEFVIIQIQQILPALVT